MRQSHNFQSARDRMLDEQLRRRGIHSPAVLDAMARVPREVFVPSALSDDAYADRALLIDCQQTISQPYIVALMSEALRLTGRERVLEIGTGTGYQTAILAELSAAVYSVERHELLSSQSAERLSALCYRNVQLRVGDGTLGWPEAAPFDCCLIAAAAEEVPPAIWDQLTERGILVAPLGTPDQQTLFVHQKMGGRMEREALTQCRFVPLVSE